MNKITESQIESHYYAVNSIDEISEEVFLFLNENIRWAITEHDLSEFIKGLFYKYKLKTNYNPIVKFQSHPSITQNDTSIDPKYIIIRREGLLKINIYAKKNDKNYKKNMYANSYFNIGLGNTFPNYSILVNLIPSIQNYYKKNLLSKTKNDIFYGNEIKKLLDNFSSKYKIKFNITISNFGSEIFSLIDTKTPNTEGFIISTKIQIINPNEINKADIKTEFNTNILFTDYENILSSPKVEIKLLDTSR